MIVIGVVVAAVAVELALVVAVEIESLSTERTSERSKQRRQVVSAAGTPTSEKLLAETLLPPTGFA